MTLNGFLRDTPNEYRPAPFWSWNDRLQPNELRRQIQSMDAVGIGGFFMHARGGLQTEYLSEEWFEATAACLDEGEKLGMSAWCYDENGWPSGFAGMKLLNDPANHCHYLTHEFKPEFDAEALAVYVCEGTRLRRVYGGESGIDSCLCVFDRTNDSVVDILNPRVTDAFIAETHERYYSRFGEKLVGFFTDEPQYFRWDTAYTPVAIEEYRRAYGEELLDTLGALFTDCDGAYRTRFRYWKLMNRLYTENFAGRIYAWCEAHGCRLTGHTVEESSLSGQMWCCAGAMPFYEYEHIPGVDWLGRGIGSELEPKQVASAAAQLGKKQVLTETFAVAGWDVTPRELKRIAEWQYVNGVNFMCHHLYPYSIRGQRKRDYPAFYSEHNTWTKPDAPWFRAFNSYFSKLGRMLAESVEHAPVGVIHPIHSAYLTYRRRDDSRSIAALEKSFTSLIEELGAKNIGHHYIDESLLEKHGSVEGAGLRMGERLYQSIVIPEMDGLDGSTVRLLAEFAANGGKIYRCGRLPRFVDGEPAELPFASACRPISELRDDAVGFASESGSIRSTLRRAPFGSFLYAVNLSETEKAEAEYTLEGVSAGIYDLLSGKTTAAAAERVGTRVKLHLSFEPGQSYIILPDAKADSPSEEPMSEPKELGGRFRLLSATQNALTLDTVRLSLNGSEFGSALPVTAVSDLLLRSRANRTIWLEYAFNVSELPEEVFVELENSGLKRVLVNGTELENPAQGTLDRQFLRYGLSRLLRLGENKIVCEIDYSQSSHVYEVFNQNYYEHGDGTESLINCLSYDTDIEAIYILGRFGVSSASLRREGNIVWSDGGFALVREPEEVDYSHITESGFPFFAGTLVLEQTLPAGAGGAFRLPGRYASAEIELDGAPAASLLFTDLFGIPAAQCDRRLTIRLTSGCRNLYGPFHCARTPEPKGVWPELFTNYGTWRGGRSPDYRDSYAFVAFGG